MVPMPSDDRPDDPFAELTFDEAFVRGAEHHEGSAAERRAAARAHATAARRAERRARAHRRAHRRALRSVGHTLRGSLLGPILLVVLLLAAWWQSTNETSGTAGASWASGDNVELGVGSERPTPRDASSGTPLGRPATPPADPGPFRFVAVQPGTSVPVTYDPCRAIPYVVNDRTAPPGAEGLIEEAVAEIARITGLRFVDEGSSDEPAVASREPFQPDRYGDRWAPVLVAWTDPDEHPDLTGDVAGLGGSNHLMGPTLEREVFVSGNVLLDGPQLATILGEPEGSEQVRAIIIHELAHLVGLDHVDDPTQLMNPTGSREVTMPASGDVMGLIQLGQGTCLPQL